MKNAVTASQMKEIDRLAQERFAIPSIILMENAGRAAAEEILKRYKKGSCAVFCGRGNNGGDGFVTARYLKKNGIKPVIFLLGKISDIRNKDPFINLTILKRIGVRVIEISEARDFERAKRDFRYNFVIDAIFGIGFKGKLPEKISTLINFLNKTKKTIYSLDVPSGMDATTGEVDSTSIKAYKTITFGLLKKGFLLKKSKSYTGRVLVKDIGFPCELIERSAKW